MLSQYDPAIFKRVRTLDDAKRIILTQEKALTTSQRWERETPHICDLIDNGIRITGQSVVLDHGCGVGRIAKELIRRHACWVIGVDISPNMRALAASYVASDRFLACDPEMLPMLKVRADVALSVWVLQHVHDPLVEICRLQRALASEGWLFVVNECSGRFVPTAQGWASDGVDVRAALDAHFNPVSNGRLSAEVVGDEQSQRTFWAAYSWG
jgi:ubiquinone/menaquinone biosynthesis C-methylase UbiE